MGMQVLTSMMGSGALAAPQDPTSGRRMPLPIEQNTGSAQTDSGQAEAAISARQSAGSRDSNRVASDLEQINNNFDRRLQFVLDQESRDITVKVIDRQTDTVIKVLPPEELQRLNNVMGDTTGVLLDRTM